MSALADRRQKAVRVVGHLAEVVAGVLFCSLVVVVGLQVVSRSVLNVPISWTEEVARYLLIWLTMIGCAGVALRGEHIGLGMGAEPLQGKLGRYHALFLRLVIVSVLVVFVVRTAQELSAFQGATPALRLPRWLIYLSLPVGFLWWALVELLVAEGPAPRVQEPDIAGTGPLPVEGEETPAATDASRDSKGP